MHGYSGLVADAVRMRPLEMEATPYPHLRTRSMIDLPRAMERALFSVPHLPHLTSKLRLIVPGI